MASVTRTAVKPLQGGVGYQLTAGEEWAPEAVSVEWDGTAAAGNFVVAVSYYNDGGALIDRAFPEGVTNAPGDTGRTFFRPFKRGGGTGAGGGGIQFDTFPQAGDWLEIDATEASGSSPRGYGIELRDRGAGGIELLTSNVEVAIGQEAALAVGLFTDSSTGTFLRNTGSGEFRIRNSSDQGITIEDLHQLDDGQGVSIQSFRGFVQIGGPASVGIVGGDGTVEGVTIATESGLVDAFAVRLLEHSFELLAGGPSGTPILRVTGPVAGTFTYEIQAGAVWQATL